VVAFTIIFNGLHHLLHNDYAEYLASFLDRWVFVEGLALPGGSTRWCKLAPEEYHKNGRSVDGTIEFLQSFAQKHSNVSVFSKSGAWLSKDEMVNVAMEKLDTFPPSSHMFEIDVDEVWTKENMLSAITDLDNQHANCGQFHCECYVGPGLKAYGEWGEGKMMPYIRLWKYRPGMRFATHEAPVMRGGNGHTVLLPQKFKHYSYYFEKDVKFKDSYYSGHEGIYANWLELQKETVWPQPLSRLIKGSWGQTKTTIEKESS
jgi:hypothetical protein